MSLASRSQPSREVLLLVNADKLDGYQTACIQCPINTAARRSCVYEPWPDQSLAIEAEKMALERGYKVEVIIMTPSADGGMPHTRAPNIICLPAYFPLSQLSETMDHELVHISQRQNSVEWRRRALGEGWQEVAVYNLPAHYIARCRFNPDTFDSRFWAWEGRHVPLPLFTREDKPELRDITVRWWDMEEERLNPHPPTSFVRRYGNLAPSSAEHPYELWAYS